MELSADVPAKQRRRHHHRAGGVCDRPGLDPALGVDDPSAGRAWAKAAVIHDYLYSTQGNRRLGQGRSRSSDTRAAALYREEADWILRDAMEDRGVGVARPQHIWAAVRVGGQNGWNNEPSRRARRPILRLATERPRRIDRRN